MLSLPIPFIVRAGTLSVSRIFIVLLPSSYAKNAQYIGTQIYNLPAGATTFSESYTYASTGSYSVIANIGDSDYSNNLVYASTGGTSPNPGQLIVLDLQNNAVTTVGNLPGDNVTEIVNNPALGHAWLQYGANDFQGEPFNINTGAAIGSVVADTPHANFNALTYIGGTLYATGTPAATGTSRSRQPLHAQSGHWHGDVLIEGDRH